MSFERPTHDGLILCWRFVFCYDFFLVLATTYGEGGAAIFVSLFFIVFFGGEFRLLLLFYIGGGGGGEDTSGDDGDDETTRRITSCISSATQDWCRQYDCPFRVVGENVLTLVVSVPRFSPGVPCQASVGMLLILRQLKICDHTVTPLYSHFFRHTRRGRRLSKQMYIQRQQSSEEGGLILHFFDSFLYCFFFDIPGTGVCRFSRC